MKRCSRCKCEKPLAEFSRDKQSPDGLNRRCRPCKTELSTIYNRANPEKRREMERRHYAKDAGRRQSAWRRENPERWAEIRAAYRTRNPESRREESLRRRARILAVTVGSIDLEALWILNNGCCQLRQVH